MIMSSNFSVTSKPATPIKNYYNNSTKNQPCNFGAETTKATEEKKSNKTIMYVGVVLALVALIAGVIGLCRKGKTKDVKKPLNEGKAVAQNTTKDGAKTKCANKGSGTKANATGQATTDASTGSGTQVAPKNEKNTNATGQSSDFVDRAFTKKVDDAVNAAVKEVKDELVDIERLVDDEFTKKIVESAKKAGHKVKELNVKGKKTTIIRDKDTNVILYSDRATDDGARIFSRLNEDTKEFGPFYKRSLHSGLKLEEIWDPKTNRPIRVGISADGKLQRKFVDGRAIETRLEGKNLRVTEKYSGRIISERVLDYEDIKGYKKNLEENWNQYSTDYS